MMSSFCRRPPSRCALAAALAAAAALGCAPAEVGYRLRFPSEEVFLLASTARVEVYDGTGEGEQGPDAICRKLSVLQAPSAQPLASSGNREVCEFAAGVALQDIDAGRLVFAASVDDAAGTTIVQGCTVVDVTPELDAVEIQLSTLPSFADAESPRCPSAQAKCAGECPAG